MNIIKKTLTFKESIQFIDGVIDSVFTQDEEGNDIDYSPSALLPLLQSTFLEMYTDFEFSEDFDKNFEFYSEIDVDYYTNTQSVNGIQLKGILKAIDEGIDFRKQKLINSQSKPVDEAFDMLATLLSTLNSKAQELDVKKLDKILKKLNPSEVMKAYQKSGIGEGVRDKAIQELSKENKDLKNDISARNVKA